MAKTSVCHRLWPTGSGWSPSGNDSIPNQSIAHFRAASNEARVAVKGSERQISNWHTCIGDRQVCNLLVLKERKQRPTCGQLLDRYFDD